MNMKLPSSSTGFKVLLMAALVGLLFPTFWSFVLSTVHFFSENQWSYDWLVVIDFLWLEIIGVILLVTAAFLRHRFIRRTLWTLLLLVVLLGLSLTYAAVTSYLNEGVIEWATLDLLTTGGLIIAFNLTLWVLGSYAALLLREIKQ